jgi:putative phosphoribosyl transferase
VTATSEDIALPIDDITLEADLTIPDGATGIVVFAHGSGSSRHSPRNRQVATVLQESGLATLLMDLLTVEEERIDEVTRHLRFDLDLLAERLVATTDWLAEQPSTAGLRLGFFGASTGAGAALIAAAQRPERVAAVVSRGGRPDLAGKALPLVQAPTLLIVGGKDYEVIELNREAAGLLQAPHELVIVPGATHLFSEPGTLEQVAHLAADWFVRHLGAPAPS